jgi:hypothetical protein
MLENLDKAIAILRDAKAGWVNRRDAVDLLGEAAGRAWKALQAHKGDGDVDVRSAVQKALERLGVLPIAGAQSPRRTYTLKELVCACEKPGERSAQSQGDGYVIEVKLKSDRRQLVYVMPEERKEGLKLIRVHTDCGKPSQETLAWALRANMQLAQGFLAICGEEEGQRLVLTNTYLSEEATPTALKVAVKEIAFYGDWLENKLASSDTK